MSKVKNRLKIYGSIKDIIQFINDNYEKDIYHPSDGKYPSNYILFFGKMLPTPDDILDDKNKIYRWRMNNWGTPFLSDSEEQVSEINIFYRHSYDYTKYSLSSIEDKFNPYTIHKLLEYSEMIYGDNIHPDENELITIFNTTLTPPTKLINTWVNIYKYTSLVFKLDYWDSEDRYAGNIHFDYQQKLYVLEHHVKEHNLFSYTRYLVERNIKTIDEYAGDITDMIIEVNDDKTIEDYNDIESMVVEEIESKDSFDEQIKFIVMMLEYLSKRKLSK